MQGSAYIPHLEAGRRTKTNPKVCSIGPWFGRNDGKGRPMRGVVRRVFARSETSTAHGKSSLCIPAWHRCRSHFIIISARAVLWSISEPSAPCPSAFVTHECAIALGHGDHSASAMRSIARRSCPSAAAIDVARPEFEWMRILASPDFQR